MFLETEIRMFFFFVFFFLHFKACIKIKITLNHKLFLKQSFCFYLYLLSTKKGIAELFCEHLICLDYTLNGCNY